MLRLADRFRRPALVLAVALTSGGARAQAPAAPSPEAADALGVKIALIRQAASDAARPAAADSVQVREVEMESFVLYRMGEEIPPRVDAIDVNVRDAVISAEAELTFDAENRTGNVIVDTLLAGTHTVFVEGRLQGRQGRGEFELREVRIDDFTVPLTVIQVLVSRFVTPRYPAVDLDEPFDIPWGIEEIRLLPGRAEFDY